MHGAPSVSDGFGKRTLRTPSILSKSIRLETVKTRVRRTGLREGNRDFLKTGSSPIIAPDDAAYKVLCN
jgi:hypothetical protein